MARRKLHWIEIGDSGLFFQTETKDTKKKEVITQRREMGYSVPSYETTELFNYF